MGCITISRNAGVEGPVVVEKLLASRNPHLGYNAQTGEYVDMVKAGIIDAAKVTKTALVDAASVASLLTTSEVVITEAVDNQPRAPEAMGGGMAMRGMRFSHADRDVALCLEQEALCGTLKACNF